MDATHLPAVIGACPHCHFPLYADAPVAVRRAGDPVPPLAHVACEVNEHRRGEAT